MYILYETVVLYLVMLKQRLGLDQMLKLCVYLLKILHFLVCLLVMTLISQQESNMGSTTFHLLVYIWPDVKRHQNLDNKANLYSFM